MNKTSFSLLLLLFSFLKLQAKIDIGFEQFTIEDGLSNNVINCIYQDRQGYLWIGTNKGLNRYDGDLFRHLSFGEEESDIIVTAIYEDSGQTLWAFTGRSVYRMEADTRQVRKYELNTEKLDHSNERDFPEYIFEDSTHGLWISSYFGTYRYDHFKDRFVKTNIGTHRITAQCSHNNRIYLGTYSGKILRLNTDKNCWDEVEIAQSISKRFDNCHIIRLEPFDDSTLLVATRLQLYTFGLNNRREKEWHLPNNEFFLRENEIHDLKVLNNDLLWIGTFGNGIIVKNRSDKTQCFVHLPNRSNSLTNNNVNDIFRDKDNVIWVGTQDGLNKYNPAQTLFRHYWHDPGNPNASLPFNFVSAFSEDPKGNIWIGTHGGGISRFDPVRESFTNYRNIRSQKKKLGNVVRSVAATRNGNVWIGSIDGLVLFNPHTQRAHLFTPPSGSTMGQFNVMSLIIDHRNRLWVGTYNQGIATIQLDPFTDLPIEKQFTVYLAHDHPHALSHNIVRTIQELEPGKLFIGTYGGGLNILDTQTRQFTQYKDLPGHGSRIKDNNVSCIHKDGMGRIWIGTWTGLNLFDPSTETFRTYTTHDGLVDNKIIEIQSRQKNRLWIATLNGLCSVEVDSCNNLINPVTYSHKNGLQGNYFCAGASLVSSDGKLYLGGSNGFNLIDEDLLYKELSQEIVLTNIQRFNQDVPIMPDGILRKPLDSTNEIFLQYADQIVSVEFSVLNFSINQNLTYHYQLEGVDKTWVSLPKGRQKVTYNNLPVGNHRLKVKAQNIFGSWTPVKILVIHVSPPFWKTVWATLIYIAVSVGILLLIALYLYNRQKTRYELKMALLGMEKEREMSELKLCFFTNISHEFKTPLTLIMAAMEKLQLPSSLHKQIMSHNVQRMEQLIDQLIDFRRLESPNLKLEAEQIELNTFIQNIKNNFYDLSKHLNIGFSFNSNTSECIVWIDRDKMVKVIYNLLSNAFKYTPKDGVVEIGLIANENTAIIEVKDTGIGIDAIHLPHLFDGFYTISGESKNSIRQSSTGIGLALCKELVALHHATIGVTSIKGVGSSFCVTLPMGLKHLSPDEMLHVASYPKKEPIAPVITDLPAILPNLRIDEEESIDRDRVTILIVEDNSDIRFLLSTELRANYQVLEAADGEEGFRKAITYLPDLIVSDVMMPRMNGTELCMKIKQTAETSHITLLMLTAKTDLSSVREGYETGADYYLPKPFHISLFLLQIDNIISTRCSQQARLIGSRFPATIPMKNEPDTVPSSPLLPEKEMKLLTRIEQIIETNVSDSEFDINRLASELNMSQMQFYRKIKSLVGMAPNEYLRFYRLNMGHKILSAGGERVSEVAYRIGFNDPLYFSRSFKKQFGISPSKLNNQKDSSP